MIFKVDDSLPTDSVDYHWSETSYDGAPDSLVHWHKYHDEVRSNGYGGFRGRANIFAVHAGA
jgi:hypothetical protein